MQIRKYCEAELEVFSFRSSFCPLVERRPATSYSVRQAFCASPRIRSAKPRISTNEMPGQQKQQVSIARFYDWSDDVEEMPVSKFYRDVAGLAKNYRNRDKGINVKSWCSNGVHLNTGRMFLRDKASLTKGEREIIAGIYNNRGDIQRSANADGRDLNNIRSHKDAWLMGKNMSKREISYDEDFMPVKISDNFFSRQSENRNREKSPPSCYLCGTCKEKCSVHRQNLEKKSDSVDTSGRVAPPTTPDHSPKVMRKKAKVPPINSGAGAVVVDHGDSVSRVEEKSSNSSKKKVYVDVFLPKISTQLVEEKTLDSIELEPIKRTPPKEQSRKTTKESKDIAPGHLVREKVILSPRNSADAQTRRPQRLSSRSDSCSGGE